MFYTFSITEDEGSTCSTAYFGKITKGSILLNLLTQLIYHEQKQKEKAAWQVVQWMKVDACSYRKVILCHYCIFPLQQWHQHIIHNWIQLVVEATEIHQGVVHTSEHTRTLFLTVGWQAMWKIGLCKYTHFILLSCGSNEKGLKPLWAFNFCLCPREQIMQFSALFAVYWSNGSPLDSTIIE